MQKFYLPLKNKPAELKQKRQFLFPYLLVPIDWIPLCAWNIPVNYHIYWDIVMNFDVP